MNATLTHDSNTEPLTDEQRRQVESCIALAVDIAVKMTKEPQLLDDAIGEAFLYVCRYVKTYRPWRSKLTTHLGTAAKWGALEAYTRAHRVGFAGLTAVDTVEKIEALLPDREPMHATENVPAPDVGAELVVEDEMHAALSCLNPIDRDIVIRRHYHGHKLREIAADYGVTKERIRQRAQRAVELLRRHFGG